MTLPLTLPLPLPPPQCVVNTFVFVVIAIIHCVYSFIIPFIYRIVFIDEDNWTLRFQVITVQLISFPMWLDSWWCLLSVRNMLVDGWADTYAPAPPLGTYRLRVPASRVVYVPDAQGGLPPGPHVLYVRGTRTSL